MSAFFEVTRALLCLHPGLRDIRNMLNINASLLKVGQLVKLTKSVSRPIKNKIILFNKDCIGIITNINEISSIEFCSLEFMLREDGVLFIDGIRALNLIPINSKEQFLYYLYGSSALLRESDL